VQTLKARLVDVAREAGVSPKTVSNYLNGYPFMSERTIAKVRAAVEKLDYTPNRSAQTLRTGKIGIIGVAVPNLRTPYFAELASMITDAAEARGYTLLIDQTGAELERERRAVSGVGPQALDGLIIAPLRLSAADVSAATSAMPVVVLGEWAHPRDVPYVGVDNVAAARDATQYLLDLGRTRIAALGEVSGTELGTWGYRMRGYSQALRAAGIKVRRQFQPKIRNFSRQQGAQATEQLLKLSEPPDALFCFSDMLAVGALSVLHREGIRVPEDVALIGWDDIEEASFTWPPLTSVRADPELVATTAVDYLLRQINHEPISEPDFYVDYELVVRQSTPSR
jgi:LacI family transcriptional regulator, repressor for deo operon, udp, cdd, tsx, nupC, and nupG